MAPEVRPVYERLQRAVKRIEEEGFDSSSELTVDLDEEVKTQEVDAIDTSNVIQEAEDVEGIE